MSDLEKYGQPAPVLQNVSKGMQYLENQRVFVPETHIFDVVPSSRRGMLKEIAVQIDFNFIFSLFQYLVRELDDPSHWRGLVPDKLRPMPGIPVGGGVLDVVP